jgi:hypothetical protein
MLLRPRRQAKQCLAPKVATHCVDQMWPSIEVRQTAIGRGVFATEKIVSGQIVCNYAGQLYRQEYLDSRLNQIPDHEAARIDK